MEWMAIQTNRRRFIARAAGAAFGVFAGAAAGMPGVAYAGPCSGPYGTGRCSGGSCTAAGRCKGPCRKTACCCFGHSTGCWSTYPGICCDCACSVGTRSWYCYCD
jgi:hypothetical protein